MEENLKGVMAPLGTRIEVRYRVDDTLTTGRSGQDGKAESSGFVAGT